MQGLLLKQQPLRVFCRRGTTARTVRTPQARRAVRLPTCTSPYRRATALRSPRGRAAGIRPLFIRTSATYCRRVSTGAEICPRYFETGRTYFELCPTCFFLAPMRAQHAGNQFPLFPCPPRRFPAAVPTPHLSAPRTSMRRRGARGTGTRRALLLSSAYIAEPKRCYLAKTDNFFVFIGKTQRFFVPLLLTSVRLSDIRERKALLNSSFLSNSRKIGYGVGWVATTLTLRIYTIPKGRTIYSHGVSGCCLSTP